MTRVFMLLTAIAIWLEEGFRAPILYRQTRTVTGSPAEVRFPAFRPSKAGRITWTVTVDDGVPDVDRAVAHTLVNESRLPPPVVVRRRITRR